MNSFMSSRFILELLSNLVFEDCGCCRDPAIFCGFNSVFVRDAYDDFYKGNQSRVAFSSFAQRSAPAGTTYAARHLVRGSLSIVWWGGGSWQRLIQLDCWCG